MGMLLFDKSGTFVPSDYGLSVGDMLHIVAIGGGGSAKEAGGATSFGSLLTVAGGAAAGSTGYGGEGGWHPALPVTLCSSLPDIVPKGTVVYSNAGGAGCLETLISSSSSITTYYPFSTLFGGVGFVSRNHKYTERFTGSRAPFCGAYGASGSSGSNSSHPSDLYCGGGGAGYGAGGGGGYAYAMSSNSSSDNLKGGAHGVFDWLDYVLTAGSPASFAITVGAGGAQSSAGGQDITMTWGAGASGCVAIYW